MNEVTQTLTLRGLDGEALDAAMAAALRVRGYTVFEPGQVIVHDAAEGTWERPSELAQRLGLHAGTVSRKLYLPDCPPFRANRGMTKRVISLIATPALEAFLRAGKTSHQP